MFLRLACKNILSRKSSFVIIAFIAFALMLLVLTNAIFDSTEQGVERTFVESFTGDIVIRPKVSVPLSLFGDETPVTGELTEIERLVPYTELHTFLQQKDAFAQLVPQISCQVMLESAEERLPVYLFGVDGESYLKTMQAVRLLQGTPYKADEKGCMLSESLAQALGVSVGDEVQCIIVDGISFRIRAVTVSAIYEYEIPNATLEHIALIQPATVRELLDISDTAASDYVPLDDELQRLLLADGDDDELFFAADTVAADDGALASDGAEDARAVAAAADATALFSAEPATETEPTVSTTWNFIICRLTDARRTTALIHELNRDFKRLGWPCEAVNWRNAAGSTAQYLYLLRLILNIGIFIVLAAGFIVVNNTLVISVLDRLREIGTMRALGASRLYISAECMTETLLLTCTAGVIGCILGAAASSFVTALQLEFSNEFLVQLFGSGKLVTHITLSQLGNSLLISLLLGVIAWIYPVYTALQVNPVQAMQGVK